MSPTNATHVEALEKRWMLSSIVKSPTLTLQPSADDMTLDVLRIMSVSGTAYDDTIAITQDGSDIVACLNGAEVKRMPSWLCSTVVVHGLAGNDWIQSNHSLGSVATYLHGDGGDDTLGGSAYEKDWFYGELGRDTVTYADRWAGLSISLDNLANDGQFAEADNVRSDIEVVVGGNGNDSITGSWHDETFFGSNGNDTLDGGDGNDSLSGGFGNDVLIGADGNDTLMAGYGRDSLFGGLGWDDVDYRDRWAGVNVWLDWYANDGESGENDWVTPDIEAVWGGHGNDRIVGSDGDNALFGINGDDTLIGLGGNDALYGWYGNDLLIGGHGNDYMTGEQDNDTLVGVGGSQFDVLVGNDGIDTFWADAESTENVADADATEYAMGHVNRIASFMTYHFASNNTNVLVGRDPDGEDLPDPTGGSNYADFSAQPLFTWPGPNSSDIDQNALGDCYFLATIGSMAHTNSDFIARSMVELGDGSYAVRFFRDRIPVYVRVDGDLPTNGSGALVYAGLGANGALWGAIAEKAWAFFRVNDSNYQSAAGGWPDEVYRAFGVSSTAHGRNIFGNWEGGPDALINYILNEWIAGKSVTVCTPGTTPGLLVGSHAYGVESLYWNGSAWRIILRNPWGGSGAYVDLGASDLAANIDRVDSAFVA